MRLHVPIRLRWSDLDAYAHVNNAEMLRLLEEARIEAFWSNDEPGTDPAGSVPAGSVAGGSEPAVSASADALRASVPALAGTGQSTAVLDGRPGAATLTLIARLEIEYLAPIPYLRAPIDVQLWIGKLGGASLDVCYEVRGPVGQEPQRLYARATTTIVLVDAASGRPRKINAVERAAWTPYLEFPVDFTRK
ncbi:thioesterase family protein [Cryobacterium sp. PAMC25264]|uniref:acyl-CoA thioesterase n=1 Tax=Cryobacterium sp. PAMC25264 TaxID=2861288 RepID=UPI001C62B76D|nr:thioesterase family protein [Cryobacterium sp. PAMC25264]QYF75086.1 acyl-CoA thioesterase [Cryobacterium sp. PAMC25264]